MNDGLKWLIGIACVLVSIVCVGVIAFFALAIGGAIADEAQRRAAAERADCALSGRRWIDGECVTRWPPTATPDTRRLRAYDCDAVVRSPPRFVIEERRFGVVARDEASAKGEALRRARAIAVGGEARVLRCHGSY